MSIIRLMTDKEDKNKQFVIDTQPQGGMSFGNELFAQFSDSKRTTLHIVDKPTILPDFWLYPIVGQQGIVATVDYKQDKTINYLAEISSTVNLLAQQMKKATGTTYTELEKQYELLLDLSSKMNDEGETIKFVDIKITISDPTQKGLETKVNDTIVKLRNSGYIATPFLDQQKQDWQGLFLSYDKQRRIEKIKRYGFEMPSEAIAEGFAHNQTFLHDETGFLIGHTQTGGVVYFDSFYKDSDRLSYNMFFSGTMGGSKSTSLKKIAKDNLVRGNHVYGYDKSGEFKKFTKDFNGIYMKLGGNDGMINLLQVFPTSSDDYGVIDDDASFTDHIELTLDRFGILSTYLTSAVRDEVSLILSDYYRSIGFYIGSSIKMAQLKNTDYPTVSDFNSWFEENKEFNQNEYFEGTKYLNTLVKKIMNNYKKFLVGHTTFRDLTKTKCAFFDISMIDETKTTVYDCLFHLVNTYITNTCMRIGRTEKRAWEMKEKPWWQITRCLIVNDECQNTLNISKPYATSSFAIGMSEGRKFFIGYALATQLIERMFPKVDNVSDKEMAKSAQSLSELIGLCQYKFFMKQSDTSIPIIKKYFGHHFRETDYTQMTEFKVTAESGAKMVLVGATPKPMTMYFEVSDDELNLFQGGA